MELGRNDAAYDGRETGSGGKHFHAFSCIFMHFQSGACNFRGFQTFSCIMKHFPAMPKLTKGHSAGPASIFMQHRSKLKIFAKNRQTLFAFLLGFLQKSWFFDNFHRILHRFWWFFFGISPNILENVEKSWNFQNNFWKILIILLNSDRIKLF